MSPVVIPENAPQVFQFFERIRYFIRSILGHSYSNEIFSGATTG